LRRGEELEWLVSLSVLAVVDAMVFRAAKSFDDSSGFLIFCAEQLLLLVKKTHASVKLEDHDQSNTCKTNFRKR
jgi:hypothetical protein